MSGYYFRSIAAMLALITLLVGCGGTAGQPASQTAAPPPSAPPPGQDTLAQRDQPADGPLPLSGVVRELRNDKLVLERMDGSAVTVTLTDATAIRHMATAQASDVGQGGQVTVIVEEHAGARRAMLVQIGGAGRPEAGGPASAPASIPLGDGPRPPAGARPQTYTGAVSARDGETLTLELPTGESMTVALTPQTSYQQEVDGDRSALRQGAVIIAEGTRVGPRFTATAVRVVGAAAP